jgi:hypothetical protein
MPVKRLWGVNDPTAAGVFNAAFNCHVEQLTP